MPIKISRRDACLGLSALCAPGAAFAQQAWPSKTINVVVGSGPGDPADVIARLMQTRLVERLGQSWVIDNKPAASAKAATQAVVRSAPDGHSLLVTMSAHVVNPASASPPPWDTAREFSGVSLLARQPLIVAVHPSVKGANLKEFIDAARADPTGKRSYSSPGIGTLSFLVGEQIVRRGKIEMAHVPFRGGGPAVQALMQNEVQLCALIPAILMPHIKSGAMRAIAVTSDARLPELPDTPTLKESGFDIDAIYNWIGIFVPAGTPQPVITRLNAEINGALGEPAIAKWLNDTGFQKVGSTPEALDRFVVSEIDRWKKFTSEFGVRFE